MGLGLELYTTPALISKISAPAATWASASLSTVKKSPASSSAANFFLPVGFILSPITQKGWSKPKTAVLVLDSTTVLTIFFPYTWFAGIPEVPPFSVTHLAFVFIPPSGKK